MSATNVAHPDKRGNICVGHSVSATMCPRLPGPLAYRHRMLRRNDVSKAFHLPHFHFFRPLDTLNQTRLACIFYLPVPSTSKTSLFLTIVRPGEREAFEIPTNFESFVAFKAMNANFGTSWPDSEIL